MEEGKKLLIRKAQEKTFLVSVMGVFWMMRKLKIGSSARNVENGFMACLVFMVNVLLHFHVTFVKNLVGRYLVA